MKAEIAPAMPLLLDAAGVAALVGISRSKLYAMYATGEFAPIQHRCGGRRMWRTSDVKAWVAAGLPNRERWLEMQRRVAV